MPSIPFVPVHLSCCSVACSCAGYILCSISVDLFGLCITDCMCLRHGSGSLKSILVLINTALWPTLPGATPALRVWPGHAFVRCTSRCDTALAPMAICSSLHCGVRPLVLHSGYPITRPWLVGPQKDRHEPGLCCFESTTRIICEALWTGKIDGCRATQKRPAWLCSDSFQQPRNTFKYIDDQSSPELAQVTMNRPAEVLLLCV